MKNREFGEKGGRGREHTSKRQEEKEKGAMERVHREDERNK